MLVQPDPKWINPANVDATIRLGDLVDRKDIARRLKVSTSAISRWTIQRNKTGFPLPLIGIDNVRGVQLCLYHLPDVMDWYWKWQRVKPRGGRPKVYEGQE